jgi:hypothetical protein
MAKLEKGVGFKTDVVQGVFLGRNLILALRHFLLASEKKMTAHSKH